MELIMNKLLKMFLEEEVDEKLRQLLLDDFNNRIKHQDEIKSKFEFNHFELTFDFEKKSVLIEDILDESCAGEAWIDFEEYIDAVRDWRH
jgi:hypothetical protein